MKNSTYICRCGKMCDTASATEINEWLLCPACADAEWIAQGPKVGKSGIKLYPAIVRCVRVWVTIPEEDDFD